ncbi:MAG: multidrug effflux MFS transporter [Desulfobacteraceae bacterium]|nr:multidrug effflux MFS transporter [Desulfobacteraceae bacterium]
MLIKPNSMAFTVMLAGLTALPPLSIDMNLPAIPPIEAAFGLEPGQGALTLSLFLLGFAFAPLIGGPVTDRFGRKPTLLVALFFNTAAAWGCVMAGSFDLLLVFRMLQGTAAGVCILMPLAVVKDTLIGADARRQLSRIMFVVGLAPLLAPIIGSWVLSISGWRSIYGVQGGLGILLFFGVGAGFAETLCPEQRLALNFRQIANSYKAVFTNRTFWSFAIPMALSFGCMFAYIAGSPGLLLGKLNLSAQSYSFVFALTAFGLMIASYISSWLGRIGVSPRSIISPGLVLMAAAAGGALMLALSQSIQVVTIVPLLFTVMFCFGLIQPNAMAEAVNPFSHIAGTASGVVNALQMLAGSISSAFVTFLGGFLDPGLAMTGVMACTVLLAGGFYVNLKSGSE